MQTETIQSSVECTTHCQEELNGQGENYDNHSVIAVSSQSAGCNHPVDKGGRHVHHFALLSFPVCGNFIMIAFLSRNAEHIEF